MYDRQLKKRAKKSFVFQQDESDCGVAALASIIQFHQGYVQPEKLRTMSGTTTEGTSMLGLLQSAEYYGLSTEAYEASIDDLKEIDFPVLLHIVKHEVLEHYIVCYGISTQGFLIGDPEDGIKYIQPTQLSDIWKSNALLTFSPSEKFIKQEKTKKAKYNWVIASLMVEKNLVISTIILGLVISGLNFSTAIFTEKLIDNLVPSRNVGFILSGLLGWLLLMILKTIFSYQRRAILIRQSFSFNMNLIDRFINDLVRLPKVFFDSRKKGDFISRLFDTERIYTSVGVIISQDLIDVVTLVVAIFSIFLYNSTIGLFLVAITPMFFSISYFFHRRIYIANRQTMSAFAANESSYIDKLDGIEAIKQYNQEQNSLDKMLNNFGNYQKRVVDVSKQELLFKTINDSFGILSIFYILIFSITSVLSGILQIGDMIAIFSISTIALSTTGNLAYSITHLQEAQAALDRTFDILSIPSENSKGLKVDQIDRIKFHNASFNFAGSLALLEEVSFEIEKGKIYSLTGENGKGKSTIFQMIQRFHTPNHGDILINDISIHKIETASLRKAIGVVPQHIKIFNTSLLENICFDPNIEENHILPFLSKFGFDKYFLDYPQGLKTILGEDGVKVSEGQKQLIALSRALYHNPDILLLDEFTSSMDAETEQFALDVINRISKDIGILMISHNPVIQKMASVHYTLKDKKVCESIQV